MASTIVALPMEILEMIANYTEYEMLDNNVELLVDSNVKGLVPLSSTCKSLRAALIPRLFRELRFSNLDHKADSYLAAVERYGQHVKSIHFTGVTKASKHGPCHEDLRKLDWERYSIASRWANRPDELVSGAARELLRGTHMPNLRSLEIKWAFDWNIPSGKKSGFQYFHTCAHFRRETREDIFFRERGLAWRALIKLVYETIAENHVVDTLSLQPIIPKLSEVFYSPAWSSFLGRLKSLRLGFPSRDEPLSAILTTSGFLQFMEEIGNAMYSHAKNVTDFAILGAERRLIDHLGLRASHFPLLQSFVLGDICVTKEVLQFMTSHHQSITHLVLYGCYAICPEGSEATKWSHLFKALQQSGSALNLLVCEPADHRYQFSWNGSAFIRSKRRTPWCDQIYEELEEDKDKKIFEYASTRNWASTVWHDFPRIQDSFREGEDHRTYDELMKGILKMKITQVEKSQDQIRL